MPEQQATLEEWKEFREKVSALSMWARQTGFYVPLGWFVQTLDNAVGSMNIVISSMEQSRGH